MGSQVLNLYWPTMITISTFQHLQSLLYIYPLEVISRRDQLASKAKKKEEEPRGRGRGRGGRGGRGAASSKNKKDEDVEESTESEPPPRKVPSKIQPEGKVSESKDVPTKRVRGKAPPEKVEVEVPKKRAKKAEAFMIPGPIDPTCQKFDEIGQFVDYIFQPNMEFGDLKAQTKECLASYGLTYTRLTIYWTRSQCALQVQDGSSDNFKAAHFFSYPKEAGIAGYDHVRLLVTIAAAVNLVAGLLFQ